MTAPTSVEHKPAAANVANKSDGAPEARSVQRVDWGSQLARFPVRVLFGIPVHAMRMSDVVEAVDVAIRSRLALLVGVVNAAKVVNMRRSATLHEAVTDADITLADGMSIVWASRLLRRPLPERVAGIDLMFEMLALAHRNRYRVYCLGASEEIVSRVAERIREDYPNATVAGYRNGYFKLDDEETVADEVRQSRADMLFVAISPPKKEEFLARWSAHMDVPVCHGVGGSFDVYAGKVRRAPRIWQITGMEWLYRVIQEPRRMWRRYLVTNTWFFALLVSEWVRSLFSNRTGSPRG